MAEIINIIGRTFGRLVVREYAGIDTHRHSLWKCDCQCGGFITINKCHLVTGHTRSCGCLQPEVTSQHSRKHGLSQSAEHRIWQSMKQRCFNPKTKHFHLYGGRGITVDPSWLSFEQFYQDMGPKPFPKFSIERKNVNGPYSKDNCIWADQKTQARNTRVNVNITYQGKTQCLSAWAEEFNIDPETLRNRIQDSKWPVEIALTAPSNSFRSNGHILELNGKSHSISEWSRIKSINLGTLWCRMQTGWSISAALTTPVKKRPS